MSDGGARNEMPMDITAVKKLTVEELADFLKGEGIPQDTVEKFKDEGIDGSIFIMMNPEDTKELVPSFVPRKKVNIVIEQLKSSQESEVDTIKNKVYESPTMKIAMKPSSISSTSAAASPSPSPSRLFSVESGEERSSITTTSINSLGIILNCPVLSNPDAFPKTEIDSARKRIIRVGVDTLMSISEGPRPTELGIRELSRLLAQKFRILRDDPTKQLIVYEDPTQPGRENYKAVTGQVRRRIYNTSPAVTNRGKKRKSLELPCLPPELQNLKRSLKDDFVNTVPEEAEKETTDTHEDQQEKENTEEIEKNEDNSDQTLQEHTEVEDRGVESLDNLLTKCTENSNALKVMHLLKLTVDKRKEYVEELPTKNRLSLILKRYPAMKKPKFLIENMILYLDIKDKPTLEKLTENVLQKADEILDFLSSNGLLVVPLSKIKSEAYRVITAFANLPLAFIKAATPNASLGTKQLLVHIVKNDQTWQEAAEKHAKVPYPWILAYREEQATKLMLMCGDQPISKCSDIKIAILAMMGLYYVAMMPYPSQLNWSLLFIQRNIIKDKLHEKDNTLLMKHSK